MRRATLGVLALLGLAGCRTTAGASLPVYQAGSQTPLQLRLPSFPRGETFDLSKERGKVVLLDVWATWCEPCRAALPTYEALAKEYGGRGLDVYTINVDATAEEIRAFLVALQINLPVLIDKDGDVAEHDLRVRVMPTTFLIDKRGLVRDVREGFQEEALMQIQTEIEGLLAEKVE